MQINAIQTDYIHFNKISTGSHVPINTTPLKIEQPNNRLSVKTNKCRVEACERVRNWIPSYMIYPFKLLELLSENICYRKSCPYTDSNFTLEELQANDLSALGFIL